VILLNGNADLTKAVPGMKSTSSTVFEQMKDHLHQIITALSELQLKNSRVKVVQFSGVESMAAQYEPGGNGNSRLYGLDHYREEVKFKKPSQVSKKKLTRIEPLNHQSHLALCLQDTILDLVRMRQSERVTTQTTLLILSDTQFELKGLKNGLASRSQWTIDSLAEAAKGCFTFIVPLIYCSRREQATTVWAKLAKTGEAKNGYKPLALETESVVRLNYDINVAIDRIKCILATSK